MKSLIAADSNFSDRWIIITRSWTQLKKKTHFVKHWRKLRLNSRNYVLLKKKEKKGKIG